MIQAFLCNTSEAAPPAGAKGMTPQGACCPIPNADYLYPDYSLLQNNAFIIKLETNAKAAIHKPIEYIYMIFLILHLLFFFLVKFLML